MILLYHLTIALLSLWSILFINHKFIQPALLNKTRFKLFELRDKLAILAMNDIIDQNCDEYNNLMNLINDSIIKIHHFELIDFIKFIAYINRNDIKINNINSILGNVKKQPNEYKNIFKEYLDILHNIFLKKLRLLFFILPILISVLKIFKFLADYALFFSNKKKELDYLNESLNNKKAFA